MTKELKAFLVKRRIEKTNPDFEDLDLRGYTSITDDAAQLLEGYEGIIDLDDLVELSVAAATSLAKTKASIGLTNLSKISQDCAMALSQHDNFIYLGVTELADDEAAALASGPALWKLAKLETLKSGTGAVNLAKKLSSDGLLYALYSLVEVSDDVASAVPELEEFKR